MRIEQLEYLAAVTEHGSLRRASEHLHLSQPALSEAITKLERELRVTLLDRRRTGARISPEGRDLLPVMAEVLGAVDRLRVAAGSRLAATRHVRLGTVHGATSTLLVPALRELDERPPGVTVEVLALQQSRIDEALCDGGLDLGLVNVLAGDAPTADLTGITLVRGRPVVVLPAGHGLALHSRVSVEQLREERFVMMRGGHLMHRYLHRVFGTEPPRVRHSTDGAETGKALVADGLGVTVLPDYAVHGDPLHRSGLLLTRPITGDRTEVDLVLRRRRSPQAAPAVRDLVDVLVATAARHLDDMAS